MHSTNSKRGNSNSAARPIDVNKPADQPSSETNNGATSLTGGIWVCYIHICMHTYVLRTWWWWRWWWWGAYINKNKAAALCQFICCSRRVRAQRCICFPRCSLQPASEMLLTSLLLIFSPILSISLLHTQLLYVAAVLPFRNYFSLLRIYSLTICFRSLHLCICFYCISKIFSSLYISLLDMPLHINVNNNNNNNNMVIAYFKVFAFSVVHRFYTYSSCFFVLIWFAVQLHT